MDQVQSPGIVRCCRAIGGAPIGLIRPRRADSRFLQSLTDWGMPAGSTTVELITLPQNAKSVPTAAVAEGLRKPPRIDSAMTAFVVRHPEATFVVDPGICADVIDRAVSDLPWILRVVVTPPADVIDLISSLRLAGVDPAAVDFALPTHLHWDHVSGLLDLPDLSVRLHRPEHNWAMTQTQAPVGGVRPAVRGRQLELLDLDGPPILTFERSHDLFEDGSVVLVDLPGHTPGSIGLLLRTAFGPVLLAGDAIWHNLQVGQVRQKASYPGVLADVDRTAAWRTVHRLHAIRNIVKIIPSHDHHAATSWRSADHS